MKALAVLAFFLGVLAVLNGRSSAPESEPRAAAVAANYVQFRQAVLHHVFALGHMDSGEIGEPDLPSGWTALRPWKARIDNGRCYVWGEASWAEQQEIAALLYGTYATGRAEGGRLVPGHGASVPLPDFIPRGNVVSVFLLH